MYILINRRFATIKPTPFTVAEISENRAV